MTALPPKINFTDPTVTEGGFKTAINNLRDYLSGLLGSDGTVATGVAALGLTNSAKTDIDNNYTVAQTAPSGGLGQLVNLGTVQADFAAISGILGSQLDPNALIMGSQLSSIAGIWGYQLTSNAGILDTQLATPHKSFTTITDVSTSHVLNTTYTNSNPTPILVTFGVFGNATTAIEFSAKVDAVYITDALIPAGFHSTSFSFVVPPGSTYQIWESVTGAYSNLLWSETH